MSYFNTSTDSRSIAICGLFTRKNKSKRKEMPLLVSTPFNFLLLTNYAYHLHNGVKRFLPFKQRLVAGVLSSKDN